MIPRCLPLGRSSEAKPQFNGDAAFLFFLQSVGIGAGDCFDEAGLAMVNMSGSAKNDFFHD